MNWAIGGTLAGAVVAGIFALIQAKIADRRARDADRSATTTKTIELGVTELINQYREANEELRDALHEMRQLRRETDSKLRVATAELAQAHTLIETLRTENDDLQSEIIRLKRLVGEI